jgi:ABC transport system ATP-binding/permease protein
MAFCSSCGKSINQQSQFCRYCGARRFPQPGTAGSPGTPPVKPINRPQTVMLKSPSLIVHLPTQMPLEYPLTGEITIGRDDSNRVVLPLSTISRYHAKIFPHNAGFAIMDLGSSNGTYLQGSRIPPQKPMPISDNSIIRIGDNLGNSITMTVKMSAESSGAPLKIVSLGKAELANASCLTIGRDPQSNIHLNSPLVSWNHAEIIRTASGFEIRDLGSTNGTFVNGKKISRQPLQYNDQIYISSYKIIYNTGGLSAAPNTGSIRLDCINLTKTVPIKPQGIIPGTNGHSGAATPASKAILNNVNLTIMPREFVALVGGSGAGKSTLMDALNGFRRASNGVVMVNGEDLYQNYDIYRADLGYVPQYDILHTDLTVRRALTYSAMLRLPPDTKSEEIAARVEQALTDVQMERQIDQKISSLSGGQRKRVSIAAELLSEPSLFFLDEPTSGLDPGLDKHMMNTLNQLSDNGRTIVLTTHATNNINNNCNLVAFMAFGRLVYYGPPRDAPAFFGVNDFSDIYNLFKDPKDAETCEARFLASPHYKQYISSRQSSLALSTQNPFIKPNRPVSLDLKAEFRQFSILVRRYLDLIFGNYSQLFILLAVMPIIGFLLRMIANPNAFTGDPVGEISNILKAEGHYNIAIDAQRLMLMLALSAVLLGVFASAYEVVREINVYRRERMINLHIPPYLGSKVVVLIAFGLVQCLTLLLVVGSKTSLPKEGVILPAPLEIFITLFIALFVGVSVGLLISTGVKSDGMVIYLVLVVLFLQIIFSGAIFDLPDLAKPISTVTPVRWVLEGLGCTINVEKLNDLSASYIETVEINGQVIGVEQESKTPMTFSVNYEHSVEHLLKTWLILLVFGGVCLTLSGLLLKRQDSMT